MNLPSNLLRAAAILVDYTHGFPPGCGSFNPPAWVKVANLLPEAQRGSLLCDGFKELSSVQEGDTVVLTNDIESDTLHAGMAGIVVELPESDEGDEDYSVQFGASEDCPSKAVAISAKYLRTPRPGDLLENYRL